MNRSPNRFGATGYLCFLLWTLGLVALLPADQLWLPLAAVILFALLDGNGGLQIATRPRFWIFALSIVALAPFVLGTPDRTWGPLHLSWEGFETGLIMALRAIVLMLAFEVSLGSLTLSQLVQLFDRAGLRGLGFALGVAFNLIEVLQEVVNAAYHTVRLRGGFRRPVQNVPLLLVTIIANALRYGDDVVKAAAARAFDPNARPAGRQQMSGRFDRVLFAGLVAAGASLVFLV